ncbi:MAG: DUF2851 family protein [Microscillaceae bacterium]|nr:DUF2851 family protein [Microscillaceae bacterium]MDW8461083.1 DUF2851 family protein [Cytophagales bacterium]
MHEYFLHFVWQYQKFDTRDLYTTAMQKLQILEKGYANKHAGADFSLAKICLDGVEWVGNVEIHLKTSDWELHEHSKNENYNNVILHVVWEHDKEIIRQDGTPVPTLCLQDKIDKVWLARYQQFLATQTPIICQPYWDSMENLHKIMLLDKALSQRLEQKAQAVSQIWHTTNHDWEETAYQLLAQNMGFKRNAEPFLALAQRVPYKILAKHTDQVLALEALLLGTAGLLDTENTDEYTQKLQKEYHFLRHKYQLTDRKMLKQTWQWAKLRPANFPTLRIAQFAQMIAQIKNLFSFFTQADLKTILQTLQITPSPYWHTHYQIAKKTDKVAYKVGKASAENIVVNTIVPLLACVAKEKRQQSYLNKAIEYLENLPAEQNHILEIWQSLGMKVKTAFDSQALIQQYNHMCVPKQCLACTVGNIILR